MSLEGDYLTAREQVLRVANRVIGHQFDPAEDPGWQAELDDEQLDEAVVEMAAAINAKKEAKKSHEANA
jgi:hypothetical protein